MEEMTLIDDTPLKDDALIVFMSRAKYTAMVNELAEYKALIKVCDRCNKKECAEFVYPGKDGLEYCQTCYDDMFPREWGV